MLEKDEETKFLNNRAQWQKNFKNTFNDSQDDVYFSWDDNGTMQRDPYSAKYSKPRINTKLKGKNLLKQLGGNAGLKQLGGVSAALSTIVGALLGNNGLSNFISNGLLVGGGLMAAYTAASTFQRIYMLKNQTIPRDPATARTLAILAATERAELQKQCHNIQLNLKKSMSVYETKFQNDADYVPINWETLQELLRKNANNFTISKFTLNNNIGGDTVDVNIDTNFNDINVTEGKLLEADYTNQVENNFFKNTNDCLTALKEIIVIAELYCESYALWYQWTRYIQVLIKYFPDDLKWGDIIKSVGKRVPNETFSRIFQKLFPGASKLANAVGNRYSNKDGKSRKDIAADVRKMGASIKLLVVNDNFEFENEDGNKLYFVILQTSDGERYALLKSKLPNAQINDYYTVKNLDRYVTNNTIFDNDGDIPKLLPQISKVLHEENQP